MKKGINLTTVAPYSIFPSDNGGKKAIALLYSEIAKQIPVQILSTTNCIPPKDFYVDVQQILGKSKFRYINPLLPRRIYKIMQQNNSRNLVMDHPYMGWMGVVLKWLTGIHLIIRSHNIESIRFRSLGKWWWGIMWHYEKWIHRKADVNWFITEEDQQWAIQHYKLPLEKCVTVSYGTHMSNIPSEEIKLKARSILEQKYSLTSATRICLFVGALDYAPNYHAVEHIIRNIHPVLSASGEPFHILICGRGLPAQIAESILSLGENITYAGFVADIETYFLGADVFLNPITEGGGIKTKLIEALGYGLTAVSTKSGAFGVTSTITGDKLQVVEDDQWGAFSNCVLNAKDSINIPVEFYKSFNWSNIAMKAVDTLRNHTNA